MSGLERVRHEGEPLKAWIAAGSPRDYEQACELRISDIVDPLHPPRIIQIRSCAACFTVIVACHRRIVGKKLVDQRVDPGDTINLSVNFKE